MSLLSAIFDKFATLCSSVWAWFPCYSDNSIFQYGSVQKNHDPQGNVLPHEELCLLNLRRLAMHRQKKKD